MFRKSTLAFCLAALAAPALAAPEPVRESFVRDGVRYNYTVEQRDGARILRGTADGASFRLVVAGERVSGHYDHQPIVFSLAEVRARVAREQLAAR